MTPDSISVMLHGTTIGSGLDAPSLAMRTVQCDARIAAISVSVRFQQCKMVILVWN